MQTSTARALRRMTTEAAAMRAPRADDSVRYGEAPPRWKMAGREGVPTRGEMRALLADDTDRAVAHFLMMASDDHDAEARRAR